MAKMCTITDYTSSLSNRWITLAIGYLQSMSSGPAYAIAIYTADIRHTFDMTESQYGLIATLYMIGQLLMFLPGFVLDHYGPITVSVISLILTLLSHGSVWWLAKYEPFPGQPYLLYASFFCAGLSIAGQAVMAVSINLSNFQKSAHGKVSGTLGCSIFLGGAIFTQLYTRLFASNLSDYFLVVTIYTGTVSFLMFLFVRRFPLDNGYDSMDSNEPNNTTVTTDPRDSINPWKSYEFYALNSICILLVSGAQVLLFMLSLYTHSLGFEKHDAGLLTMSTIITSLSDLVLGIMSDIFLDRIPRIQIALIISLARMLALLIGIFHIHYIPALVSLMVTNSITFSVLDTIMTSELHENFGDKHYGKILGMNNTLMGLATLILQYATTWFYEKERKMQDSPDEWCHGKICVLPGLLMMSILNIIAVVLMIMYLYRRRKSNRNTQEPEYLNNVGKKSVLVSKNVIDDVD